MLRAAMAEMGMPIGGLGVFLLEATRLGLMQEDCIDDRRYGCFGSSALLPITRVGGRRAIRAFHCCCGW